jgi:hypothetical protein
MIELLESRIAPALSILYYPHNDLLTINGDPENQNSSIPDLKLEEVGGKVNIYDGASLFSPSFGPVNHITITLLGDNDVSINLVDVPGGVALTLGAGDNNVDVINGGHGPLSVVGNNYIDNLKIEAGAMVGGGVTFSAQEGINSLINLGAIGGGFIYAGGKDIDNVLIGGSVGGNVVVGAGQGTNFVTVSGNVFGVTTLNGSIGPDTFEIGATGILHNKLVARTGGGGDTVNIKGNVQSTLQMEGSVDADNLNLFVGSFVRNVSAVLFGGNNVVQLFGKVSAGININATSGNDTISVGGGLDVKLNAKFVLGSGNNFFSGNPNTGTAYFHGDVIIDATSGDDHVNLDGTTVDKDEEVRVTLDQGTNTLDVRAGFSAGKLRYNPTLVNGVFLLPPPSATDIINIFGGDVDKGEFQLFAGDDSFNYYTGAPVFKYLSANGGKGTDTFAGKNSISGIGNSIKAFETVS